jgi:hypothetical protein
MMMMVVVVMKSDYFTQNLVDICYSLNLTKHFPDMKPERRKCVVREAPQRCPLLDNGSVGTFRVNG